MRSRSRTQSRRATILVQGNVRTGAGQLGIATHVVREAELAQAVEALAQKLAVGPTKSPREHS